MKKIMVVDDDPDILYTVRIILERGGYGVIRASSGRECLDILDREIPDLILLDIMMPGMDGWDVLKEIRRREDLKTIPVAMLTAKSFSGGSVKKRDIKGLLEYVVKPFSKEKLTESQLKDRGSRFFWIDKPFTGDDLIRKVEAIFECTS
jgi:two-component system alkaline phosphatase synthesis response regulator PhoP